MVSYLLDIFRWQFLLLVWKNVLKESMCRLAVVLQQSRILALPSDRAFSGLFKSFIHELPVTDETLASGNVTWHFDNYKIKGPIENFYYGQRHLPTLPLGAGGRAGEVFFRITKYTCSSTYPFVGRGLQNHRSRQSPNHIHGHCAYRYQAFEVRK